MRRWLGRRGGGEPGGCRASRSRAGDGTPSWCVCWDAALPDPLPPSLRPSVPLSHSHSHSPSPSLALPLSPSPSLPLPLSLSLPLPPSFSLSLFLTHTILLRAWDARIAMAAIARARPAGRRVRRAGWKGLDSMRPPCRRERGAAAPTRARRFGAARAQSSRAPRPAFRNVEAFHANMSTNGGGSRVRGSYRFAPVAIRRGLLDGEGPGLKVQWLGMERAPARLKPCCDRNPGLMSNLFCSGS